MELERKEVDSGKRMRNGGAQRKQEEGTKNDSRQRKEKGAS